MPGSASKQAPVTPEVPLGPAGPGSSVSPPPSTESTTVPEIAPENVPRAPPPPPPQTQPAPPPPTTISPPPTSSAPPPPPPPPPPRRSRRLRVLLYLLLAGALSYGGAVAYAMRNDNFHDFFTEYVPFGERILLDIEERNFRKKFPTARINRTPQPAKADDPKVTIPSKSGLSWKVSEENQTGSDLTTKGKHMSAVDAKSPTKAEAKDAQEDPKGATPKEATAAVERAKTKSASKDSGSEKAAPKVVSTETPKPKQPPAAFKSDETSSTPKATSSSSDTRPPLVAPVTQISTLAIANADEQVVQDLVKVVNDLITVINADTPDAANKYSAPMQKAKDELAIAAGKIGQLREVERKAAEERIAQAHKEFDDGARQLLQRIETAQKEDDIKYREEFEAERAKIAQQYEQRLKTDVERTQQVAEQRFQNMIAEQAIEMKRKFISDIQSLVESEREGRLSKLTDLSSNVDNLTQLTSNWNGVIDSNLATQKLQVAVDAVKSALQTSNVESKPKPFVREMAALKLTADGDPVVEAAVASINPQAYQRGIPSAAQLIDRFRRVASEVRKASLLPEDAGVASHAASVVLSKVMFKKQGQPEGNDVESILTRTETLLEEGDLDSAAREMNGLQGWAGVLSKDWLNDARKVLEVQQALDVIETEARLQCLRVS